MGPRTCDRDVQGISADDPPPPNTGPIASRPLEKPPIGNPLTLVEDLYFSRCYPIYYL